MDITPVNISDVAKVIQLALAPVFLLTGIAGILNVMTGRLSRIIDRGRLLIEDQSKILVYGEEFINIEIQKLEQRRHLASISITSCTISALLTCMVITALFLEVMLNVQLNWIIAFLFTISTLALVIGLSFFLREVHLATKTIRIKFPHSK